MSENNFSDLFRQIERSVQDLASLGATELKHVIDETVREVRNTVNGTVEQYRSAQKKTTPPPSPSASYTRRYANVHQPDTTAKMRRKASKQPPIPTTLAVHPSKVPGKISGKTIAA